MAVQRWLLSTMCWCSRSRFGRSNKIRIEVKSPYWHASTDAVRWLWQPMRFVVQQSTNQTCIMHAVRFFSMHDSQIFRTAIQSEAMSIGTQHGFVSAANYISNMSTGRCIFSMVCVDWWFRCLFFTCTGATCTDIMGHLLLESCIHQLQLPFTVFGHRDSQSI